MAMAITLNTLRSGREVTLPQNICSKENGPSNVSFIKKSQTKTVSFGFCCGQKGTQESTRDAEGQKKYFSSIKFSTQVLISLWKSKLTSMLTLTSSMLLPSLHHFCAI